MVINDISFSNQNAVLNTCTPHLDQHIPIYSFSKLISTLGVFALGALLSGLYYERSFINLEIQYDICTPQPTADFRRYMRSLILTFGAILEFEFGKDMLF